MTSVRKLTEFPDEVGRLVESKESPEKWYVLIGQMCGEYSVQTAEKPEDYDEQQQELPNDMRDATENVDGFMQIGAQGWASQAFADDCDFVSEYAGYGEDKIDPRMMNILLVHEDMLSEEAIEAGNGEYDREEAEQ